MSEKQTRRFSTKGDGQDGKAKRVGTYEDKKKGETQKEVSRRIARGIARAPQIGPDRMGGIFCGNDRATEVDTAKSDQRKSVVSGGCGDTGREMEK